MKIESFEEKLGSWLDMLAPFIISAECDKIYATLKKDAAKETVYPKSADTFRAFKECDKKNLKLIAISMEPYSSVYYDSKLPQGTGLALDCANGKIQPSLEYFLKGIAKEFNLGYEEYYKTNNLSYLAEQGVLLGNRSLTVKKGKIGSHVGVWDNFWKFFFERIQSEHPYTPVLLLGKDAAAIRGYSFEMANPVWELTHPSAAARTMEDWNTKNTFSALNNYIRTHKDSAITWSHKLYEEQKEAVKKLEDEKDSLEPEQYEHQKMLIRNFDDTGLPF